MLGGVFGTTLGRLGLQTPKKTKRSLLNFCVFLKPLSYQSLAPKAPAGLNFEWLWTPFGTHSQQIWKNETAILCGKVLKNQAFGGMRFNLFRHFHVQVVGTFYIHASFDDLPAFYTFVHPLEAHF